MDRYEDMYGIPTDWNAAPGYDTVLVLNEIAESDRCPIDALFDIDIEGLEGSLRFDEYGATYFPLTVVDGRDEILW